MNAIKRVVSAPWLLLSLWLAQLVVAFAASKFVVGAVDASMRGYAWLEDGHMLGAIAELLADNPAVSAAIKISLAASLSVGALLWIFAGGAIFERLGGKSRGRETVAAAGRWAASLFGLTLWSLIVRGLLLGVGLLLAKLWAPLGFVLPLWYVLGVLAFDEARARVVLEGASAKHPRTSFGAVRSVIRRPFLVLAALVLVAAQWGVLAISLTWAAKASFGASTMLAVRALSLIALALGLVRISAVIGHRYESGTTGEAAPAPPPTA